jgi:hypothetical protein
MKVFLKVQRADGHQKVCALFTALICLTYYVY